MTNELTESEYRGTMNGKMQDVTETAEPVVDIWPYVELLVKANVVLQYVFDRELVESVYRSQDGVFDHILIPTDNSNCFTVVVVDLLRRKIKGHYKLDLNKEYGI